MQNNIKNINLPFYEFLEFLKRQGFIIGVDHYLRLQNLLHTLSATCQPSDLKYLLCPIFATNKKQQQQFYNAFNSFFKQFETKSIKESLPTTLRKEKKEKIYEKKTHRKLFFVLFAIIILSGLTFFSITQYYRVKANSNGQDSQKVDQSDLSKVKGIPESPQSVEISMEKKSNFFQFVTNKISELYTKYRNILRWVIVLFPIILLVATEFYRFNRRRLILQKQRGKKPPFVWPILVEAPELAFLRSEKFYSAARFLRRRLKSDIYQLDVSSTISNTIKKAGFPDIQFKSLTSTPEYLILIDLPTFRDHYSHLFDNIARALEEEGVLINQYFYENDPRICFKNLNGDRFYLADLQSRFGDSHLIIFGNGEELLDPISGELDNWINLFHIWRNRAILTPKPISRWGIIELELAREFFVLPASFDGLNGLIDYFETENQFDLNLHRGTPDPNLYFESENEYDINKLKNYFGKDTFQWLCACAVYPELHWDLTLYLGSLPCFPNNLINEDNLRRLFRLPWFQEGIMPDELRWSLINELDRGKICAIREAIIDLLGKNPAPKESIAYDNYYLNLVMQEWILSRKNRKHRKEMLKTARIINEKQPIQDYTLIRFLESASKSLLDLVLPQRFLQVFFRNGVRFFGIRTSTRLGFTILAAALILILFPKPQDKDFTTINVELLTNLYTELPTPVKDQFNKIVYIDNEGKLDLEERFKIASWLKCLNQGNDAYKAKEYEKAVTYYDRAYKLLSKQPIALQKLAETKINDALDLSYNDEISITIRQKSKKKLEIALDEAKNILDEVLIILIDIEKKGGQEIYDSDAVLSPNDLKGRTYYQLGRLFLIKSLIDMEDSAEYLKLAYSYFNISADLKFADAIKALDYMENKLKYKP